MSMKSQSRFRIKLQAAFLGFEMGTNLNILANEFQISVFMKRSVRVVWGISMGW